MNNSLDIVMASLEHLDLLTGLASGFRDQLGRSTPTDVELSVSIRKKSLLDPGYVSVPILPQHTVASEC